MLAILDFLYFTTLRLMLVAMALAIALSFSFFYYVIFSSQCGPRIGLLLVGTLAPVSFWGGWYAADTLCRGLCGNRSLLKFLTTNPLSDQEYSLAPVKRNADQHGN